MIYHQEWWHQLKWWWEKQNIWSSLMVDAHPTTNGLRINSKTTKTCKISGTSSDEVLLSLLKWENVRIFNFSAQPTGSTPALNIVFRNVWLKLMDVDGPTWQPTIPKTWKPADNFQTSTHQKDASGRKTWRFLRSRWTLVWSLYKKLWIVL